MFLGDRVEGEAREVAGRHAELALQVRQAGPAHRHPFRRGTDRDACGKGRGGPNQEYALALAMALRGAEGIAAVAGDTDGTDGGGGDATTRPAPSLTNAR